MNEPCFSAPSSFHLKLVFVCLRLSVDFLRKRYPGVCDGIFYDEAVSDGLTELTDDGDVVLTTVGQFYHDYNALAIAAVRMDASETIDQRKLWRLSVLAPSHIYVEVVIFCQGVICLNCKLPIACSVGNTFTLPLRVGVSQILLESIKGRSARGKCLLVSFFAMTPCAHSVEERASMSDAYWATAPLVKVRGGKLPPCVHSSLCAFNSSRYNT